MGRLPLTKREQEVLNYTKLYINLNECSPTFQEIANEFLISKSGVQYFIDQLKKKGKIRVKRAGLARNIVILDR